MSRVQREWRRRQVKVGGTNCAWWRRYYKLRARYGQAWVNGWYSYPWHCPAPVKRRRR